MSDPDDTIAISRGLLQRIATAIAGASDFLDGFRDDDTQEEPIDDTADELAALGEVIEGLLQTSGGADQPLTPHAAAVSFMIVFYEEGESIPGDCHPDLFATRAEAEAEAPAWLRDSGSPYSLQWAARFEVHEIEEET